MSSSPIDNTRLLLGRRRNLLATLTALRIGGGGGGGGTLPLPVNSLVIDVSHNDGTLVWSGMAAAGIRGVIIRCGYGDDDPAQDDTEFAANIAGAVANNIPYGIYIYSYATSLASAQSEAEHVQRLAAGLNPTLGIWWDSEEPGTELMARNCYNTWRNNMLSTGYSMCGVYASTAWYNSYLSGVAGLHWVADWGVNDGLPHTQPSIGGDTVDLWQYTSNKAITGIGGSGIFDASLVLSGV